MQPYSIYFPYFTLFKSGFHHRQSYETSSSHGCDSNLRNCSPKPFCCLDHSQFLYSIVHNTANIHGLDFAADCIPFLPGVPPSNWAMVSQRFHSPLYLHTPQYLLQCLWDRVNNGGRQTNRHPFVDQSHALLRTTSRLPSRTPRGLLAWPVYRSRICGYCVGFAKCYSCITRRIRRSVERTRMASSSVRTFCKTDPPFIPGDTKDNQAIWPFALLFIAFAWLILRPSYELFLWAYRAWAVLDTCAMWPHVKDKLAFRACAQTLNVRSSLWPVFSLTWACE